MASNESFHSADQMSPDDEIIGSDNTEEASDDECISSSQGDGGDWVIDLQKALQNDDVDGVVKGFFYTIREGTIQGGHWIQQLNGLLSLSVPDKEKLLKAVTATDYLRLSQDTSNMNAMLNKQLLHELMVPALGTILRNSGGLNKDTHDFSVVGELNTFFKSLRDAANTHKTLVEAKKGYKHIRIETYQAAIGHHQRVLEFFDGMMEASKLPNIEKSLSPINGQKRFWYPFRGLNTVLRLMEVNKYLEPLKTEYVLDVTNEHVKGVRDVRYTDGNEMVSILEAIDDHFARPPHNKVVGSISTKVVEGAITKLVASGKLKSRRKYCIGDSSESDTESDEKDFLNTNDKHSKKRGKRSLHESKKSDPVHSPRTVKLPRYEACKLVGDQNYANYNPANLPHYWSEKGLSNDDDLLAQSYGATKLVRNLDQLRICRGSNGSMGVNPSTLSIPLCT
jgi:hypothetical protein